MKSGVIFLFLVFTCPFLQGQISCILNISEKIKFGVETQNYNENFQTSYGFNATLFNTSHTPNSLVQNHQISSIVHYPRLLPIGSPTNFSIVAGYNVPCNREFLNPFPIYGNTNYILPLEFNSFHLLNNTLVNFKRKNNIIVGKGINGPLDPILEPCSYTLSFYLAPANNVNFSILNGGCFFNFNDYAFIDSFKVIEFDNLYNKIDSFYFGNPSMFNDTSGWTKIEIDFVISSSNGGILELEPLYSSFFESFQSNIDYDSIINYSQNLLNSSQLEYYFHLNYFFDSISVVSNDYNYSEWCGFNDTSLCLTTSISIDASHPAFTSYLWSTGDTTSIIEINTSGTYWLRADYACGYLTDTFTVHPAPELEFDSLFTHPDTLLLCPSELPFTLSVFDSIGLVNWNTGDFAESITIQSEGLYTASYENCDTIVDSVWVILLEPDNIDLFSFTDTTVCNEISIAVADTFQSYLWSKGSISNETTFTESGIYTLTVNDGCFDYTDSFNLVIDQLVAGAFAEHRHYCPQDFPVTLSVSSFHQPVWNTGEQSPSITLNSPQSGTFIHTSENACGIRSDTFYIHLQTDTLSQWPQINIEEQCIEQGLYYIITQVFDDNFNYQWDGQTSLNFSTTGGSTETLTISNECASFSIDTALNACPERIVFALPTAFSPNSDGVNDQFGLLYLRDDYVLFKLQVFNRWGELVFRSENAQEKWNGFYKDKPAPIGVYIYQLLIVSNGGEEELHSGNVTLVR